LPFTVRIKTKRAGEAFALVGPHFNALYSELETHPIR
jgi:hypothetical protein